MKERFLSVGRNGEQKQITSQSKGFFCFDPLGKSQEAVIHLQGKASVSVLAHSLQQDINSDD